MLSDTLLPGRGEELGTGGWSVWGYDGVVSLLGTKAGAGFWVPWGVGMWAGSSSTYPEACNSEKDYPWSLKGQERDNFQTVWQGRPQLWTCELTNIAPQAIYRDQKIPIAGVCLVAIRSYVNQIADLNGHCRARKAARGFGSVSSGIVTEPQEVLLSSSLEVRKGDLLVNWSRWNHISRADNALLHPRLLRLAVATAKRRGEEWLYHLQDKYREAHPQVWWRTSLPQDSFDSPNFHTSYEFHHHTE